MPLDATAAVTRMLMRLRSESDRRPQPPATPDTTEQVSREMASGLAQLVLAGVDQDSPTMTPSEVLRAVAVGLVGTRQSLLATRDLSDMHLAELLPAINHMSLMAESLVRLSDWFSVEEMGDAADSAESEDTSNGPPDTSGGGGEDGWLS